MGGCLSPPLFVTDRDEPYRPALIFWLDMSEGLVVGQAVVAPEDLEGAVGRALVEALERPIAGPPRRPDRIRVADEALAAEVRAVLRDDTPVAVAPTPELNVLLEGMLGSMATEGDYGDESESESYLAGGRIAPAAVADFFQSAEVLYRIAPWKVATDDQVLRMDIPELGVEGACVAVIGNAGASLGLLIFPSLAGYEAFARAADEQVLGSASIDLGSDWLALGFERGADLPAAMRREVAEQGWPVADAHAYPLVQRVERDGATRPLVERDLKIAAACAVSLTAFFAEHREVFEAHAFHAEPISESWFDERDLEVRFTIPYEAFALFGPGDRPAAAAASSKPKIGRNDPCPCGSGRKYKKCHLAADQAQRAGKRETARHHDLDGELVRDLCAFAAERFGMAWRRFERDFADPEQARQLALPWSVYHYRVMGRRSVLEAYLEDQGPGLSQAERDWLAAQQGAWLSVWEVIGVEPGESLTLRDLLSWEERHVPEASASRDLVVRDALLGRVVDHAGVSLLCGAHPRPLPPTDAAEVVRRARGRLRRKRAVPVERLRDESFGRHLIKRWDEAVTDIDLREAIPPQLQNTDGDPLLPTTDRFELEPAARSEVESRLAALEDVEAADAEGGPEGAVYIFSKPGNRMHRSWENTLIGRACFESAGLRIETNSGERADALRERVESACPGLLRHRAREHSDPLSPPAREAARSSPPESLPPEADELLVDLKRRHYAEWLDEALPVLGGQSPREAVRTARGRDAVDVLLKDIENREHRTAGRSAYDVGELRRELRLE